jgi:hypothetical protein
MQNKPIKHVLQKKKKEDLPACVRTSRFGTFSVTTRGKCCGTFKTVQEAVELRDYVHKLIGEKKEIDLKLVRQGMAKIREHLAKTQSA